MFRRLINTYGSLSTVAKATLWFTFCGIMQKGVSLLTTPIFTRLLTTEQYGQYTLYNSWLSIFTIFCTFRLDKAVFNKGMSKYPNERPSFAASMQVATNILTVGLFIIYLFCHTWVNELTGLSTFITCALFVELFFHPAFNFYNLIKRYEYRYVYVVAVTLSYVVANAVLGVVAVLIADGSYKGDARILSNICVAIIFGLILYVYNFFRAHFKIDFKHIKFAVKFNLPLIPHYFSTYILDQSDKLMIAWICDQGKVGIYGVAYNIGLLLKIVTDSIHSAFTPWQYEKMRKGEINEIETVFFPMQCIIALLLLLFMAFAPEVVYILADERYREAVYAIPPVCSSILFISAYGIYSNAEFYFDANKFSSLMTFIGAGLNVVLNFIFIHLFGYIVAAYTTLFCYTVFAYAHFIYANRIIKNKSGKRGFAISKLIGLTLIIYAGAICMSILYQFMIARYSVIAILISLSVVKRKDIYKALSVLKK